MTKPNANPSRRGKTPELRARQEAGIKKPLKLDEEQIRQFAAIGCTDEEIAIMLKCTVKTIERERKRNAAFRQAVEEGRATGKVSLRRAQMTAALKGNVAAQIWLGKQYLGQKERHEHSGEIAVQTETTVSDDGLAAIMAALDAARARVDSNGAGKENPVDGAAGATDPSPSLPS